MILTHIVRMHPGAGWLKLANDVFYLVGSAVFRCCLRRRLPLSHGSGTEDFIFSCFQSDSWANTANTVNMNAPPLYASNICGYDAY
jgi:hypothetical protein